VSDVGTPRPREDWLLSAASSSSHAHSQLPALLYDGDGPLAPEVIDNDDPSPRIP